MREEIVIDNQSKNLNSKANGKPSGHPPKPKSSSSWGSQIVKGFVTDKKSKSQVSIPNKKQPVASLEVSSQKNQCTAYQSRAKRSLIGEFPCSANAAQVHPHALDNHRLRSPSSHDLFIELDHLRSLLRDSKDRELALQSQLLQYKENPRVSELEKELDAKRTEIECLNCRVGSLQVENDNLFEQVASLTSILEAREDCSQNPRSEASGEGRTASYRNLEMEVVELRRLNKELQLQKRSLAFRLSSTESQHAALAKVTEVIFLSFKMFSNFSSLATIFTILTQYLRRGISPIVSYSFRSHKSNTQMSNNSI